MRQQDGMWEDLIRLQDHQTMEGMIFRHMASKREEERESPCWGRLIAMGVRQEEAYSLFVRTQAS